MRSEARAPRTRRPERPAPWSWPRRLLLPAFAALWWHASAETAVSPWLAGLYLVASIVAFVAYAIDKRAARQQRWRTPEATLLWLGLVGGWPGALLAQQLLRHKSSKPSFVAAFWLTVAVNVAAFAAWHSPWLRGLLA